MGCTTSKGSEVLSRSAEASHIIKEGGSTSNGTTKNISSIPEEESSQFMPTTGETIIVSDNMNGDIIESSGNMTTADSLDDSKASLKALIEQQEEVGSAEPEAKDQTDPLIRQEADADSQEQANSKTDAGTLSYATRLSFSLLQSIMGRDSLFSVIAIGKRERERRGERVCDDCVPCVRSASASASMQLYVLPVILSLFLSCHSLCLEALSLSLILRLQLPFSSSCSHRQCSAPAL